MTWDEAEAYVEHTPGPDCIAFDPRPEVEPPPFIGFLASPRAKAIAAEMVEAVDARVRELVGETEPLLWQDEADQA